MGRETLSSEAYRRVADEASSAGSTTHKGEQRHKEGKGLHELVDPKGYGVIRRSLSWLEPKGEHFELLRGVAILEETRLDTTGSMGNNVEIAMDVLPKTYELLAKGKKAVLGRYDTQMITAIFGDVVDNYVLCRSQAEMDERIAEQMTLMVPEGDGGDITEDPQYGIFGAAYLTDTSIGKYGLKHYDFTITDAPARTTLSLETLKRVFGESVIEKTTENGFTIDPKKLPTTKEVVRDLLKIAHGFLLVVDNGKGEIQRAYNFWEELYGSDRVVIIPEVKFLPEVKASIIGLTEGVLTLQTLEEFLVKDAHLSPENAKYIKRAVAGIPIGAQAVLENFNKIPLKGTMFAAKGDIWPMVIDPKTETVKNTRGKNKMWES